MKLFKFVQDWDVDNGWEYIDKFVNPKLQPICRWITFTWKNATDFWNVVRPAWFSILFSLSFALLINGVGQIRDVFEIAHENDQAYLVLLSSLLFAISLASFSRAGVNLRYWFTPDRKGPVCDGPGLSQKTIETIRIVLPPLLASLPNASLLILSIRIGSDDLTMWAAGTLFLILMLTAGRLLITRDAIDEYVNFIKSYNRTPFAHAFLRVTLWLFSVILLVLFLVEPVKVPESLGALTTVFLAGASWVATGSFIIHWGYTLRWPSPILIGLFAAFIFSWFNDNHYVRTVHRDLGVPVQFAFQDHVIGWLDRRLCVLPEAQSFMGNSAGRIDCPDDSVRQTFPVFFGAIEGGGSRAGYWAGAVLAQLQDEHPNFPCHLYALSSVSGGSLGAASLVTSWSNQFDQSLEDHCKIQSIDLSEDTRRFLRRDFLSPTIAGALFPDLVQRFAPLSVFPDRASFLERAWEHGWRVSMFHEEGSPALQFSSPFSKLWEGERAFYVPSLVFNGTWVSDGNKAITSHLSLDNLDVEYSSGVAPTSDVVERLGSKDIPISTAVHMTARFPIVSPAGTISWETPPPKLQTVYKIDRIVDGGYYENSGADTLSGVVQEFRKAVTCFCTRLDPKKSCLSPNSPRTVELMHSVSMDPGESRCDPNAIIPVGLTIQSQKIIRNKAISAATREFMNIPTTMFRTRDARGRQSVRTLERVLENGMRVDDCAAKNNIRLQFDVDGGPKGDRAVPLGWALASETARNMDGQIERLNNEVACVGALLE